MKRFLIPTASVLLLLSLSIPAFSQGIFATVSGTVTDSSGALIPGVSIKATAVNTGVVTSTVTNEAGAYNFANLLPGKYTISAALPGFQTKNLTDVELSQTTASRYNFELFVAGVNTQVEVTMSATGIIATQGATVGQILNQQKVQDLPLVGNNILDLISVMAGVENIVPTNPPSAANAFGRENTTFAGVRADNVSVVRDGIQMQDNRNPNGIYSITTINPDLVGEIRLILAPVDVELGRGNGSIQYTTRSGTNRYSGSAVWSINNTALNPNSWTNNRNMTLPPNSPPEVIALAEQGKAKLALQPVWSNTNQVTVSFGGPIVRNKTFFFGLFDINRVRGRSLANVIVPTPCARLGIFRYFNGWTNGNANAATTTGSNGARASVNLDGTPKPPAGWPSGSSFASGNPVYDPTLQQVSVFGPLQSQPTANDCSDAPINMTTLVPNGVILGAAPGAPGGAWDSNRRQLDTTGYITRAMGIFPAANNFETGDGLNTAGYRYLRHYRGVDNLFGSGEATGDREQYNVKIDHNFTANHKGNFNMSYELVDSDDVYQSLPGLYSNANYRRPIVLSGGVTSTLSTSLLNEARFGLRRQGLNVVAPWHRGFDDELAAILPPAVNGVWVLPTFTNFGPSTICNPHSGSRPPGSGCIGITGTSFENTPTYTYSNTVSWTRGAHAFRFNGELRVNSSETRVPTTANFGSVYSTFLTVSGGTIQGTAPGSTSSTDLGSTANPTTRFATQGTATQNGTAQNIRNMMNYLSGSVGNVQTLYYLSDPNNTTTWSDFHTNEFVNLKVHQNEFTAWAKDEWKISRNLTITPGLRWDYFGVPYLENGLTVAPVGGASAVFGVSGRDFTGWMNPGVRAAPTSFELVGPNSPNAGRTAYRNNYHSFGPSFAFAWNLPWFGEGMTVVRGGYQITYQGGGRMSTVAGALGPAPGTNFQGQVSTQNIYLDLSNFASAIPVPNVAPLQPLLTTGPRSQNYTAFDPNYTNPYVQNLTLSVTRNVNRNITLDVRYIGTLSRKTYTSLNLNTNNFLFNGLFESLDAVRAGTEVTKDAGDPLSLLDQIFAGVNLCTSAASTTIGNCASLPSGQSYGPIGTTTGTGSNARYQTAANQMRASSTFNVNLANAAYNTIAGTISTFNYSSTGSNASLPPIPAGFVGAALRKNGFPDNFIDTNPQFGNMTVLGNSGYNNYHSLQFQVTTRPLQGFSGSATYSWSKNLGLLSGTLSNLSTPFDRAADYTTVNNNPGHTLRTNGTFELPIGPNKLLLANSSGWIARAFERWQLGLIYNLSSGAPTSITATSMLYGNGLPDVRHPIDFNKLKGVRWGIPGDNNRLEGRYFDFGDVFVKVDDPSCANVTSLQGLGPRCTLDALAIVVPEGTPDSQVVDGRTVQVVLQHPAPGKKGNLGNGTLIGLGSWRFDANLSKTFNISESKSVAVRIDMQNVLNHPVPGNPNLSITGNDPFGQIESKTQGRLFQGNLRFNF